MTQRPPDFSPYPDDLHQPTEPLEPPELLEPTEPPESRLLAGARVIAWGAVCLLVWLVLLVLVSFVAESVGSGSESEAHQLVLIGGQIIAGLIGWLALPYLIPQRRQQLYFLRWQRPRRADFAWAGGGLIGIYVVLFIYTTIVSALGADSLEPQSTIDDSDLFLHTSVMIALGLLVILCAPVYEEAFARAFLLGGLRPHWGMLPAFLISASAFSALHADLGSMIPFALAGVILGVVYVRTGSLTAASMCHFGFNLIGFTATLLQHAG